MAKHDDSNQNVSSTNGAKLSPSVEAFLLGTVEFDSCVQLQQRLVYESCTRADGQIALLVCEHPPMITLGRDGSRAHLKLSPRSMESLKLDLRWLNRGGGALVHAPGQLAIYPIVPLEAHELSVGEFMERFQGSLLDALQEIGFVGKTRPGRWGIWGRTGQVGFMGLAVKDWTSYHGAFLNVDIPLGLGQAIQTDPLENSPMSSLAAERQGRIKIAALREAIVRCFSTRFGCTRYHVQSGHPLLKRTLVPRNESPSRVG